MLISTRNSSHVKELTLIDYDTGLDYIDDYIGNTGAFNDGSLEYDHDSCVYFCDAGTYDYWVNHIGRMCIINLRIYTMELTDDEKKRLEDAQNGVEFSYIPSVLKRTLDKIMQDRD